MESLAHSSFAWLDYDEEETRKARELYAALDSESVDALGLGSVRDGFANLMFPGTSTIQTRVRYFVLVAYAAQAAAGRGPRDARQFDRWFKEAELATMASLKAMPGNGDGVIGAIAGPSTKRLPSEVYWSGMSRWGVVRSHEGDHAELGSLAAYRSWVVSGRRRPSDDVDEVTTLLPFFDELPLPPSDFPGTELNILPGKEEAAYLLDRMSRLTVSTNPVKSDQAVPLIAVMATDATVRTAASIFDVETDRLDPYTSRLLQHAQGFSQVTQGARLLYNRMLFEGFEAAGLGEPPKSAEALERLEDGWVSTMTEDRDLLEEWRTGLSELFMTLRVAGVKISPTSERFVREWADVAVATPRAALDSDACRTAVRLRESSIKRRGLARLTERVALERWRGALFGRGYMDFRYSVARRHVSDCRKARD